MLLKKSDVMKFYRREKQVRLFVFERRGCVGSVKGMFYTDPFAISLKQIIRTVAKYKRVNIVSAKYSKKNK